MAEFPYLPLWTGDYLRDTRHLTAQEHGAYLLLLMEAWQRPSCRLPDDDTMLARLAGVSADEWHSIKKTVMGFWRLDKRSKEWVQKRLKKERSFVAIQSKKQSDRARSGWNKRKKVDAAAMPERCRGNAPTLTPIDKDSGANAPGADAPKERPLVEIVFGPGLRLLTSNGVGEKQARSLLGKWRNQYGDESLLAALGKAQREGALDPVGFVTGCLKASGNMKGKADGRFARKMEMARRAAERAEGEPGVDHGEGGSDALPLLPSRATGRG